MKMSPQDIARRTETHLAHEDGEPLIGGARFFRGLEIGIGISALLWLAVCVIMWAAGQLIH